MINHGGWLADLINEVGAGIVVPYDDPQKAASMLNDFLSNEELIHKASIASLSLALEKFNVDDLAKQLETILKNVVNESNRK